MKVFIQKFGITIYILLLSAHLYAQVLGDSFATVQFITKALLLPTLILFLACQEYSENAPKGKWWVSIGLFGSFLGDAFLLSDAYFIPGMIAFMTTHIFNILFFHSLQPAETVSKRKLFIAIILWVAFCAFVYSFLKDAMGALIYPILVYMVLISTSAIYTVRASLNAKAALILPGRSGISRVPSWLR